jgi:hypothetical protein
MMADVRICACGIAADDCDYHKPETKDYVTFTVGQQVNWLYMGNGQWKMTSDPVSSTGGTITITGVTVVDDNPFLTNNLTDRAEYMKSHPHTWQDDMTNAGLNAPWELHLQPTP